MGQENSSYFQRHQSSIYHVNQIQTGIIVGAGIGINYWGFTRLRDRSELTILELNNLDRNNINRFDRNIFKFELNEADQSQRLSDGMLSASLLLPLVLGLDQDIRNDWIDITLLYMETGILASNLYSWGGPRLNQRIRPLTYYESLDLALRQDGNNRLSFYSGHTLSAAASTFFIAKVYSDYHPELGNKKYILYGLALIPPTYVGYHRLKALKHFPTDVVIGYSLGIATGILIPELHKMKDNSIHVGVVPAYDGFAFTFKKTLSN